MSKKKIKFNYVADIETETVIADYQAETMNNLKTTAVGWAKTLDKNSLDNIKKLSYDKISYMRKHYHKRFQYTAGYRADKDFILWIEKNFDQIDTIFFHNIKFDMSWLSNALRERKWDYNMFDEDFESSDKNIKILKSPKAIFSYQLEWKKFPKHTVNIQCSSNLTNKSVAQIGNSIAKKDDDLFTKSDIDYHAYRVYKTQKQKEEQITLLKAKYGENSSNGKEWFLFKNKEELEKLLQLDKKSKHFKSILQSNNHNFLNYLYRDVIIPIIEIENMRESYKEITGKVLKKIPLTTSSYSQKIVEALIGNKFFNGTERKGKRLPQLGSKRNYKAKWKKRYKSKEFKKFTNPLTFQDYNMIHSGYFGGFTANHRGIENTTITNLKGVSYDANSFYPSIMYSAPMPGGHPTRKLPKGFTMKDVITGKYIKIKSFKMKAKWVLQGFPAIIIRKKGFFHFKEYDYTNKNNKYLSESKLDEYVLSQDKEAGKIFVWNDYLEFLETIYDIKYKVLDILYFKKVWWYRDVVKKLYGMKKNATEEAARSTAKLVLNAMYGKTAENIIREKIDIVNIDTLIEYFQLGQEQEAYLRERYGHSFVSRLEKFIHNGTGKGNFAWAHKGRREIEIKTTINFELSQFEDTTEYHSDYKVPNVAIGHRITSLARMRLWNIIKNDPENFIYTDTDSVYTKKAKPEDLGFEIHPSEINCWKQETSFDSIKVIKSKAYAINQTQQWNKKIEDMENITPKFKLTLAGYSSHKIEKDPIIDFNDFEIGKVWTQKSTKKTDSGIIIISTEKGIKAPLYEDFYKE